MKMRTKHETLVATVVLICILLLSACHPFAEQYPITKQQVLNEQKWLRGELVTIRGADGPYKYAGEMCGNFNTAGSFKIRDQSFSSPATPGIAYDVHSYINAQGEALIVVRRFFQSENP